MSCETARARFLHAAPPGSAPQERKALPCLALAFAIQERFPGRCSAVTLWIVDMSNDATRAATRAAAAAEAAALAGGTVPPPPDGGDATDSLTPGGNAADAPAGGGVADPPPGEGVDGVLHRLELSLDAISTRLTAVEAGREAARDPPPRVPPVLGALPPPPAPAAAASAAAGDFGLPAAGLSDVIPSSVAKVLKHQSKDKDHDTAVKDDLFRLKGLSRGDAGPAPRVLPPPRLRPS